MLDVHPPHSPTHTWKDFFIHIATIVIGLMIAVGIEQIVERIHQHEQVRQAREALDLERRQNILITQVVALLLRREHDTFSGDLASLRYLKAHPDARLTDLPAPIVWGLNSEALKDAAWKSLQGSPVAALLPTTELQADSKLYQQIEGVNSASELIWARLNRAGRYRFSTSNPKDLSPAELDAAIESMEEVLTAHFMASVALENLCRIEKDFGFKPCINGEELNSWIHGIPNSDLPKLYGASGQAFLDRRAAVKPEFDKFEAQLNELTK
jgi:hypothetical protein